MGAVKDRLNLMKDATEQNNLEFFNKEVATTISNMPLVVPLPSWLNYGDVKILYFWRNFVSDEFGLNSIPPRTRLERAPDICILESQGVSLEQVKAYQ